MHGPSVFTIPAKYRLMAAAQGLTAKHRHRLVLGEGVVTLSRFDGDVWRHDAAHLCHSRCNDSRVKRDDR